MRFLWWIPTLFSSAVIYWLSDQSHPPGHDLSPDYVMHFLGYGILSLAVAGGVTRGFQERLTPGRAVVSFVITAVYGFTDEFHQSFVPGRTAALSDILADCLGASLFLAVAFLVQSSRKYWNQ